MRVHNGRERTRLTRLPQGEFVFTAGRLWDEGKNVATLDRAAARFDVPFQAAGADARPERNPRRSPALVKRSES